MTDRDAPTVDGRARFTELGPGSFVLEVFDARGGRFDSRTIELAVSGVVRVPIPLVRIRGSVTLGGEPGVSSKVRIYSGDVTYQDFTADEKGAFEGSIARPRTDRLIALVETATGVRRRVGLGSLDPQADVWDLHIQLGDVVLTGRVVDEDGVPVPGARVWADSSVAPAGSVSEPDGRFVIEGLERTRYLVDAKFESSPPGPAVEVDATEGTPAPVTLEVPRARRTRVRIVGPDGEGVPSAMVRVYVLGYGEGLSTFTDWNGWAPLQLPAAATSAHVRVHATGRLLWSGCSSIPQESDEDWIVRLPAAQTGTLTVRTEDSVGAFPPTRFVLLREGGGLFDEGDFRNWLRVSGGGTGPRIRAEEGQLHADWILPGLAAGSYALIRSSTIYRPDFVASICAGNPLPDLDWVTLPPGGEAQVSVRLQPK